MSPSVWAQADDLAADSLVLVNLIRQRLDSCREDGLIGAANLRVGTAIAHRSRHQLTWNSKLASIARKHAMAMASEQFFDHVDPKGQTVGNRATAGGYRWRLVGENLAAGHTSLAEAMRGWLQSVTHCRNLIDSRFTEIGIARAQTGNPNDPYGSYWVMVLGKPQPGEPTAPEFPATLLAVNQAALSDALMAALN